MGRVRLNTLLEDARSTLDSAQEAKTEISAVATSSSQQHHEPSVDEVPAPAPVAAPAALAAPATTEPPNKPTRRAPTRRTPPAPESERVHYSSLIRKEARLRDDQIESLTLRARKLSRNKASTEPRITDNTLIRVAVDLLLAREADLQGTSEAELRKSVGL